MPKIVYSSNEGKLYFFNFSLWRMMPIEPLFYAPNNRNFMYSLADAIKSGIDVTLIFIYGIKRFADVEEFASRNSITVYRSRGCLYSSGSTWGLGFSRPYSLGG